LHQADRAFGACWQRGNALWGVPAGKGAFHAVGAAAYACRWAAAGVTKKRALTEGGLRLKGRRSAKRWESALERQKKRQAPAVCS